MRTLALPCARCGASIQTRPGQSIVRCPHCDTRLEVLTEGETPRTRVLDEDPEPAETSTAGFERARIENELEDLDADWARERRGILLGSGFLGGELPPVLAWPARVVVLLLGGVTLGAFLILASRDGLARRDVEMLAFALIVVGAFFWFGRRQRRRHEEARLRYKKRRGLLKRELRRLQAGGRAR
ncbi:MAG: hypothetical protein AAFZ87_14950 [Planctomycetota bacterium]